MQKKDFNPGTLAFGINTTRNFNEKKSVQMHLS